MLLNFAKHQPWADRIRGARRNEDCIVCTHGDVLKALFRSSLNDGSPEILSGNSSFQSDQHFSALSGPQRVPHLRFPASTRSFLMTSRIGVIRMHLHRKLFLRENKFHEQRKSRTPISFRASPFDRHLRPCTPECFPLQWSRREATLVARHPSFT